MAQLKADASPTKAFFVRMLTRDITLDDCILDLVDNSIDGAWRSTGLGSSELIDDDALANFSIDIELNTSTFKISDNCGGITLDEAVNYAFTFGRKSTEPTAEYTVGVYGIGMKRAIFKLGNDIRIHSTYNDDNKLVGFEVPIDVGQWAREDTPWDFDLDEHAPAEQAGVEIEVTALSSEVRLRFEDPTFERSLRHVLARDYMLPLMRGLKITVNGQQVIGQRLLLLAGPTFAPMRRRYDDDSVMVEVLAGMAGSPPDDTDPQGGLRLDRSSGWYVLCNGRVVLAADRTQVTGWGTTNTPAWHPQYNGFIGVILFSAADPQQLPMTTTKRSVDTSSAVYMRALVEMAKPTKAWIFYTNNRKVERERAVEQEQLTTPTSLPNVGENESATLPNYSTRRQRERVANVNYSVSLNRMNSLARALGSVNLTYRDVGVKSFDYTYGELVDEGQE